MWLHRPLNRFAFQPRGMAFSGNDGRSQVPTEKKRKIRETRNIFLKIRKINYFTIEKKINIAKIFQKKIRETETNS